MDLEFDSKVITINALKNAAYSFLGNYEFNFKTNGTNIQVSIAPLKGGSIQPDISSIFRNAALDHQIRIEVEQEYRVIREMIVAQAFEPCDNVDELVQIINP
jgi:His-Xaa-Ser system protein HxsD